MLDALEGALDAFMLQADTSLFNHDLLLGRPVTSGNADRHDEDSPAEDFQGTRIHGDSEGRPNSEASSPVRAAVGRPDQAGFDPNRAGPAARYGT